ncbi:MULTISPECIES: hypothetical protein [unclassified Campylobacter]|nr:MULTISPECIES: hypothetical protein [unclassified Campylobacter]
MFSLIYFLIVFFIGFIVGAYVFSNEKLKNYCLNLVNKIKEKFKKNEA